MRKLNIGCGWRPRKQDGFIDIDIDESVNPDIVRDIEKGVPFDDNSVDEIFMSHVLEHVNDFYFVMEELWRVCKPNAIIKIVVPYWDAPVAHDPDHVRCIIPTIFDRYKVGAGSVMNLRKLMGKAYFDVIEVISDLDGKIHSEPQTYFTLRVIKND